MKKIPKGAEASNILVGELNVLDKPLSAFIRLNEAVVLGDLTEVPVPTRFIFILLGPAVSFFLFKKDSTCLIEFDEGNEIYLISRHFLYKVGSYPEIT